VRGATAFKSVVFAFGGGTDYPFCYLGQARYANRQSRARTQEQSPSK